MGHPGKIPLQGFIVLGLSTPDCIQGYMRVEPAGLGGGIQFILSS